MLKFSKLALLSALLAVTATAQAAEEKSAALVNGVSIPQSRVDLRVKVATTQGGQTDSPELRKAVREDLINLEVISQAASKIEGLGQLGERIGAGEVILCGGAVNSPQLLQLSGIGAPEHLQTAGVPTLHALDPHKLVRSLEDLSVLTHAQIVLHASLARKASNPFLGFNRIDFPQSDPPEWRKFVTLRQAEGKVQVGELPLGYWGNLKENYEAHNRDYQGVHDAKT